MQGLHVDLAERGGHDKGREQHCKTDEHGVGRRLRHAEGVTHHRKHNGDADEGSHADEDRGCDRQQCQQEPGAQHFRAGQGLVRVWLSKGERWRQRCERRNQQK